MPGSRRAAGITYLLRTVHRLCGPAAELGSWASGKHAQIAAYIADAIQRTEPTPIAEVAADIDGRPRTILLKLDGWSRWGSIKGRTALGLLGSVADQVGDRTTVVESTSGNLGVALAGICGELSIPFTAVVDGRLPSPMGARMREYGARIIEVARIDDGLHLQRRMAQVRAILRADPDALWTNQYENPANVTAHRWWTGPELASQLGHELPVTFVPVSTGGTFAGLRSYLAAEYPHVTCVAVDVRGSSIFGEPARRRVLTGIGASKPSAFIPDGDLPPHVIVPEADAIATCLALARDTRIYVGGSSGAALNGCLRFLSEHPELTVALCLCPDLDASYRNTLYHDDWLRRTGVADARARPVIGGQRVFFEKKESIPARWQLCRIRRKQSRSRPRRQCTRGTSSPS
jgi:cysteine synthase A